MRMNKGHTAKNKVWAKSRMYVILSAI